MTERRPKNTAVDASTTSASELLIWQLADSTFPTGGFAHSSGLEVAFHLGEVRHREALDGFLTSSLHQAGRAAIPFVTSAHREPGRLDEWDSAAEAFLTNHVANRASRLQGRAFRLAVERGFGRAPVLMTFGHYAPTFGALLAGLGVGMESTARLFLFLQLRGWVGAAVRLGIVGPLEGQGLQRDLAPVLDEVLEKSLRLELEEAAQTSPLLELHQALHDRLYSRLFQS